MICRWVGDTVTKTYLRISFTRSPQTSNGRSNIAVCSLNFRDRRLQPDGPIRLRSAGLTCSDVLQVFFRSHHVSWRQCLGGSMHARSLDAVVEVLPRALNLSTQGTSNISPETSSKVASLGCVGTSSNEAVLPPERPIRGCSAILKLRTSLAAAHFYEGA